MMWNIFYKNNKYKAELYILVLYDSLVRRAHQAWRQLALRESRALQGLPEVDTFMAKPSTSLQADKASNTFGDL